MQYDVAIIGGGPGGYNAAEKLAEAGKRVVLFEKDKLGGTCLNRGCIPTKALLHSVGVLKEMQHAEELGITAKEIQVDFARLHARKAEVVTTLRDGIAKLMKAGKVTVVTGQASIESASKVVCDGETYEVEDIIIATGSVPAIPPIKGCDLPGVYTSNEIMEGEGVDVSSLIIIGGGIIGVECACIYLPLGCNVTILEAADHILPPMDKEIAQRLNMVLKKQGAVIEAKAMVKEISGTKGNMTVTYEDKKGETQTVHGEAVLMATGRKSNVEGLFAEGFSVEMERGVIADENGKTSVDHIYVIGDARAKNIQLAHVAEAQAKNVAAHILGKNPPVDESLVPSCVYTSPEIASVGMTEDEAKAKEITVKTGKALTGANGKCLIEKSESGYIKVVVDAQSNVLIGAQMVAPRATDMIAELAVAIEQKMTVEQFKKVIHPHPTFVELVSMAVESMK